MKPLASLFFTVSTALGAAVPLSAQDEHCPVVNWGGNGPVGDLLGGGGGYGEGGRGPGTRIGPSRPDPPPTNPGGPTTPRPGSKAPGLFGNPRSRSALAPDRPSLPVPRTTRPVWPAGRPSTRPPGFAPAASHLPIGTELGRTAELEDPTRWQLWWSFNHDPYLVFSEILSRRNRSSGDRDARRERMRAEIDLHAVPVLREYWKSGGQVDLMSQVFLTSARLARDEAYTVGMDLLGQARFSLAHKHLELHRAVVLALGIEGDARSVRLLASILRDDEDARGLLSVDFVGERTRACAAFALALLGSETQSAGLRRHVAAALLDSLEEAPLEVRLACVSALGHVGLEPIDGLEPNLPDGRHLCGRDVLRVLTESALDVEDHPWIRAHAANSIGRLGSALADESLRAQVADMLAWLTTEEADVVDYIAHSAVIGLGCLARGDANPTDSAVRQRLRDIVADGDEMGGRLAMMALAQSAARGRGPISRGRVDLDEEDLAATRELLLSELSSGRKTRKPWAALAFGVLAHEQAEAGRIVDPAVGRALRESLKGAKSASAAAASSLALALMGDENPESQAAVMRRFERTRDGEVRAFASLSLAMLATHAATPALTEVFAGGDVASLAIPLRLLGDRGVVRALTDRLDPKAPDMEPQLELVDVLGATGDPDAVKPLCELAGDEEVPHELRARAIAALGNLGDEAPLHWTALFANDVNYDLLTWTLRSPSANGSGLLDAR